MTTRIDMLNEWWENAEQGSPKPGDTIIINLGGGYAVEVASEYWAGGEWYDDTRILSRAPKPKPAWHDAVAVIAHTARFSERRPFALTHTEDVLDPYNTEWITRDDLIDPIPLIEAKVTDEMVERLEGHFLNTANMALPEGLARRMLTAALGLEAE